MLMLHRVQLIHIFSLNFYDITLINKKVEKIIGMHKNSSKIQI